MQNARFRRFLRQLRETRALASRKDLRKTLMLACENEFHGDTFADRNVATPAVRRVRRIPRARRTGDAQRHVVADEFFRRARYDYALQCKRPDDAGRICFARRIDETL